MGVVWVGVVLGMDSDNGLTRTERGQEGRWHARDASSDLKAVLLQDVGHQAGRPVLLHPQLAIVVDVVAELGDGVDIPLDVIERALLGGRQD